MLPDNHSRLPSAPGNAAPVEVEIKLAVKHLPEIFSRIGALGFKEIESRSFESNVLYDTDDHSLRRSGQALRLREYRGKSVLTFKGRPLPGRHKQREELETTVGSGAVLESVLDRLGYRPLFRYEKYRAVFGAEGALGLITVDETPMGPFLELEGPPDWIDETAQALGYGSAEYITDSYIALYAKDCEAKGIEPTHFVFPLSGRARIDLPEEPSANG